MIVFLSYFCVMFVFFVFLERFIFVVFYVECWWFFVVFVFSVFYVDKNIFFWFGVGKEVVLFDLC